ncbi:MAG: hypothetical protein M1355_00430 [Patescibacteria group bacterium]|nr:hypothetical protein [Patescibacteria group bacterium]
MTLSWDLFITMVFVIVTVYGVLLGRTRILTILLSSYVGYVIATEFGQAIFDYLSRTALINNAISTSYFGAKTLTFAAVIFVLAVKSDLGGTSSDDGSLEGTVITALYGFLAAGLIISSILSFMGDSEKMNILASSNLATKIIAYKIVWLIGPLVAVLGSNFLSRRARS